MTTKEAINFLIQQKRISQAQIAKSVGVSRQLVNYWVKGLSIPSRKTYQKLKEVFPELPEIDDITVESPRGAKNGKSNSMGVK